MTNQEFEKLKEAIENRYRLALAALNSIKEYLEKTSVYIGVEPKIHLPNNQEAAPFVRRKRARKGVNTKAVDILLPTLDRDRAYSVSELCCLSDIPWSSMRNILRSGGSPFEKCGSSWYVKEKQSKQQENS